MPAGALLLRGLAPTMLIVALSAPPAAGAAPDVDHSAFDSLLVRHVTDGWVDYDAFQAAPSFAGYLASLEQARPEALDEASRLAFWINAYNAFTIQLVNSKGERDSIRNINKTLGLIAGKGPWQEPIVRAAGRAWTLDQVEHEIIRKHYQEPRIHFALVCAAVSCPPLRNEAYTGARLDAQLAHQARRFLLEEPAKNRVDVAGGVLYVSPIFDWYKADFGGSDEAVGRYVAAFHPAGPARELLLTARFKLVTTEYDWTLNDRAKARQSKP
jgi:hypothetical protein